MATRLVVLAFLFASACTGGAVEQQRASKNPVRKVVGLLQAMEKKVQEEGVKEKELFDKYMCWCTTGKKDLQKSIADAEALLSTAGPENEAATSQADQAKADVEHAKADRQAAKDAIAQAVALREKEAAAFAAEKAEYTANIDAVSKATEALEKGSAASFVQSTAAKALRRLAAPSSSVDLPDEDRQALAAFLSEDSTYAPQSGEIVGILKQLQESMENALASAEATEAAAIKSNGELLAAKGKEVEALTVTVETKLAQVGELGVSIEQQKAGLEDAGGSLEEDKKFLAELETSCSTKSAEFEERKKTRAEELVAIADTIKILNDDDALDLFKSTLPGPEASFLQVQVSASAMRARALEAIRATMRRADRPHRVNLDFLVLSLNSKAATRGGFESVMKMIDEIVATLNQEQADDQAKKDYCTKELDLAEDKKKESERLVADAESAIATVKEGINTLSTEIAALNSGIRALDKSVADATKQRQAENADFKELLASNGAAKELLGFAKNRLNKFYNPAMYKPEADKKEPASAPEFVQISARRARGSEAPPPPPETFGAYTKKTEEGGGVIQMIDVLISDLDKEIAQAEAEEKNAQADYEKLMEDSAAKRTLDAESVTQKEAGKAELESTLEGHSKAQAEAITDVGEKVKYIQLLHNQCDWIFQYFDMRKQARADEIDALNKAKAVLSGADFALVQVKVHRHLRRSA